MKQADDRRPSKLWYLLLLIPFVGTLFPGWYSTDEPRLGGFPFFYWYQLVWVIVSAVITYVVYMTTRTKKDRIDRPNSR